jgi:hypothetical protein
MRRIERLRIEALESCKWRKHRMNRFTHARSTWLGQPLPGREKAFSYCLDCGMTVACDTYPPPNGIDIGGEAVALDCPGTHKHDQYGERLPEDLVSVALFWPGLYSIDESQKLVADIMPLPWYIDDRTVVFVSESAVPADDPYLLGGEFGIVPPHGEVLKVAEPLKRFSLEDGFYTA